MKHFAVIAKPLTNLLKENVQFIWTSEHQETFTVLKSALVSAPVLAMPDFSKVLCIEIDASNVRVGVVLVQEGHPLAFISKPLGPKTRGVSTYEKDYLAILIAVDQRRQYFQHAEFLSYTDQKSLIHLNEQRLNTPWQQKVFSKLLGLQYRLVYKKGVDNSTADALSRKPHDGAILSISEVTPSWISRVLATYEHDDFVAKTIAQLAVDKAVVPNFTF